MLLKMKYKIFSDWHIYLPVYIKQIVKYSRSFRSNTFYKLWGIIFVTSLWFASKLMTKTFFCTQNSICTVYVIKRIHFLMMLNLRSVDVMTQKSIKLATNPVKSPTKNMTSHLNISIIIISFPKNKRVIHVQLSTPLSLCYTYC